MRNMVEAELKETKLEKESNNSGSKNYLLL